MNKNSRQSSLLEAAHLIVSRDGPARLTLDAVAAEAGVSKGGVLYHFPTKEALILGMIEGEIARFELAIDRALAQAAPGPGAFARAYIEASLADCEVPTDRATGSQGPSGLGGILAAVANDEGMLAAYRAKTGLWRDRMAADGLDPAKAEIIRLAVDGLWYSLAIGAASPAPAELAPLKKALLGLAGKRGR